MYFQFRPYVSVGERRREALKEKMRREKRGEIMQPIMIAGRTIAATWWGKSWCEHLEKFHDYHNRLERGRTYVRNGSVFHLEILPGEVQALVSGSEVYEVNVEIAPMASPSWKEIVHQCSGKIGSMVNLLSGRFSQAIMRILADPQRGLFPHKKEISFSCTCPDYANMCKHVAAVLYGIGARLDEKPELLFRLRQVDESALIDAALGGGSLVAGDMSGESILSGMDQNGLSELFGIDIGRRTPAAVNASAPPDFLPKSPRTGKPQKADKSPKVTQPAPDAVSSRASKPSKIATISNNSKAKKASSTDHSPKTSANSTSDKGTPSRISPEKARKSRAPKFVGDSISAASATASTPASQRKATQAKETEQSSSLSTSKGKTPTVKPRVSPTAPKVSSKPKIEKNSTSASQKTAEPRLVKSTRNNTQNPPTGTDIDDCVISAGELIKKGFTRADIAKLLHQKMLLRHVWGFYLMSPAFRALLLNAAKPAKPRSRK